MSRWLLRINRKDRFDLVGPISRSDVLKCIRDGGVELGDEACGENNYWFSFHESEELHKHLGISWSQVRRDAESGGTTTIAEEETDEITETGAMVSAPHAPSAQAQAAEPAKKVRQDADLHPGPGSFIFDFLGEAPGVFWVFLLFALLVVAYKFFGSTK